MVDLVNYHSILMKWLSKLQINTEVLNEMHVMEDISVNTVMLSLDS